MRCNLFSALPASTHLQINSSRSQRCPKSIYRSTSPHSRFPRKSPILLPFCIFVCPRWQAIKSWELPTCEEGTSADRNNWSDSQRSKNAKLPNMYFLSNAPYLAKVQPLTTLSVTVYLKTVRTWLRLHNLYSRHRTKMGFHSTLCYVSQTDISNRT